MEQQIKFDWVISCGWGIDVHQKTVVWCIDARFETIEFNTFTCSLKLIREWCKSEGVTHVAIESTAIY